MIIDNDIMTLGANVASTCLACKAIEALALYSSMTLCGSNQPGKTATSRWHTRAPIEAS